MGILICVAFSDTRDCISQLFHLVSVLTYHVEDLGLVYNPLA